MLTKEQKKKIDDVIKGLGHGEEFYSAEMKEELYKKVEEINTELQLSEVPDIEKAHRVNEYIMANVDIRTEYFYAFNTLGNPFDETEVYYRTAYAAFHSGQAMCAGFAEAVRVLLETAGVKTYTLLSKLPSKTKQLLHYVVCAEIKLENGKTAYLVLDPERQKSCIQKGYDFDRYLAGMIFFVPDENFERQKVGPTGVGPRYCDFYKEFKPQLANVDSVGSLIEQMKSLNGDPMGSGR